MQLIIGIQKANRSLETASKGHPETKTGTSLTIHTLDDSISSYDPKQTDGDNNASRRVGDAASLPSAFVPVGVRARRRSCPSAFVPLWRGVYGCMHLLLDAVLDADNIERGRFLELSALTRAMKLAAVIES